MGQTGRLHTSGREHFRPVQQIERNIDDHVFLATDHPPLAQFYEDVQGLQTILRGGDFSVAQEA
ncbi:hypothetical protein D3C76_1810760 [compost metagenome]